MNKRHINNPERTKRGMHRYSSFFILSSSLLLLLLAACTNDPTEDIVDVAPGTLPEGTFVIDYTASTGDTRTRLAASERIQSLDYLLYEKAAGSNDFLLKRRRPIPGIGQGTQWPLTRENMTWEQREALKDTLNQSSEYKMVFVANADPEIWDNSPVLENVDEGDNFDDGRLVLPPRLFTDNNMYYMWSNHDAPLVGSNYNKDNPASMEITLERMINKVEVRLDASLVSTDPSTDIDSYLDKYLNEALAKNENGVGIIYDHIWNELDALAEKVNSTTYSGSESNLKDYLRADEQIGRLTGTEDEQSIRENFIRTFKEQMKNVEQVVTKVEWDKVSKVQPIYKANGYASALKFDYKSEGNTTTNADKLTYDMNQTDETFLFYTFGDNEENDALNQFSSFSFLDEQGSTLFELSGESITDANATGNHHIIITCDPFSSINNDKKGTFSANINLETFIDWDAVITGVTILSIFKNQVKNSIGGTFDWTLTIEYPCNPVINWKTEVQ